MHGKIRENAGTPPRWVRIIFQNRLLLLGIMFMTQMQFFVINFLNAHLRSPDAGWELKIDIIDNNLTPGGYWLIPYVIGFFFAILVPSWAMFFMPNKLFRQFALAITVAALFSYAIYILFPTYVVKPTPDDVPGDHFLAALLRQTYEVDTQVSTHNAAPSQHVFYAVLNTCFVVRFRPSKRVLLVWVILGALISASALLTMRHNSPDLIVGYVVAVCAYYAGSYLGARITCWLDDEHDSVTLPLFDWRISPRQPTSAHGTCTRSRDLTARRL